MNGPSYASPVRAQLDCPAPWREVVLDALAAAGVVVDDGAPVGVAVAAGRQVSAVVDDWSVASLPHVLVAVQPYAVEVGPWALPGVGPCARCVAAAVLDVGTPARTGQAPRPLLALAAGAVARDLGAWARGEPPHSWLTSWRFDHEPVPTARRWERHPYCGCAWFETA
ncbi:hypothetical protein GCM10011376_14060 [Nocardioides flavus (ex Wang et al. 2016)]|uniref:Bacteriocin biosynthesis cyclodehydratase domain-containing protein n=1 Tax=Nocardioides flavus (ex Wang et al. 2016) TaxID=2058780 RepID=A0ABQ3HGW2_9ACTN|nr:hypothetical protein [Nocardioides flavus (ex Wang et al. 2016)]GHE16796.1 hypothetical protein GCM10011376_14060 [Nocardioides flavus (ex Wang et al. 2016)]